MKYDAIVFDLDGTLWNATDASTYSWNEALRSLGINRTISKQEMEKVTGRPTEECLNILLSFENNNHDNLLKTINYYEKEAIVKTGGILYKDCTETIDLLARKYKLLIVSNCEIWYLFSFFNHSGCKRFFVDYDCHGMSKKNKAAMLQNLKEKHSLQDPVYIGDTESDKIAAETAKYDFIFANYGFGNLHQPIKRVNSLSELKDYLLRESNE